MNEKRILIIDDNGFGRVCSALALQSGFQCDWTALPGADFSLLDLAPYGLVIISYPYGRDVLDLLAEKGRALLVLADYTCDELLTAMSHRTNFFCAVKPLDFSNFGNLVKHILGERATL